MRWIKRCSSARSERGSTLLEVIIGLLILSLIGIGAWNGAAVSLRAAGRYHDAILGGTRILQVDDKVRGLASRIHTPYWMPGHEVMQEGGGMSVAYLDGIREKAFRLEFSAGVLSIGDGDQVTRFPGFESAVFAPALDGHDSVTGIRIELRTKTSGPIVIIARFASSSLRSPSSS